MRKAGDSGTKAFHGGPELIAGDPEAAKALVEASGVLQVALAKAQRGRVTDRCRAEAEEAQFHLRRAIGLLYRRLGHGS